MPQNEHDRYLFETFKEFFGGWKNKITDWKHEADNTIKVWLDDGQTFIFGDHGCDEWHLEIVKHPAMMRV